MHEPNPKLLIDDAEDEGMFARAVIAEGILKINQALGEAALLFDQIDALLEQQKS